MKCCLIHLQFESKVVLCEKAELKTKPNEECLKGYNVVLEDTILFPEGGGQVRLIYLYIVISNYILIYHLWRIELGNQ